jgi:hypothetical protein
MPLLKLRFRVTFVLVLVLNEMVIVIAGGFEYEYRFTEYEYKNIGFQRPFRIAKTNRCNFKTCPSPPTPLPFVPQGRGEPEGSLKGNLCLATTNQSR